MDQEPRRESESQQTDHNPVVLTESPVMGEAKQDRRLSDEWGPYYPKYILSGTECSRTLYVYYPIVISLLDTPVSSYRWHVPTR